MPIENEGTRFAAGERKALPSTFVPAFTRVASGSAHDNVSSTLLFLTPHFDATGEDATTDVAMLDVRNMQDIMHAPVQIGTLHRLSWSNVFPALVHDPRGASLVLFRRTDATLGDFYFTGGAPALSRYRLGQNFAIGSAEELGELPGLFSETVRIDRLAQ
jgi:hypothetical protein